MLREAQSTEILLERTMVEIILVPITIKHTYPRGNVLDDICGANITLGSESEFMISLNLSRISALAEIQLFILDKL